MSFFCLRVEETCDGGGGLNMVDSVLFCSGSNITYCAVNRRITLHLDTD